MPSGAPLATLLVAASECSDPGHFQATLVAQPVARAALAGQPDTVFWQDDAASGGGRPGGRLAERCAKARRSRSVFQALKRGGGRVAEPYLAWRDTGNVEPCETVRIASVQRDAGDRTFRCHILEHDDPGMPGTSRAIGFFRSA
ncbi:hypothetical protein D1Y85_01700 [Paraburkholderia dinghuensis]|uniref:Plastocyanin-like domain-containing protein n=1 Tax=Paraburkholderia dinghuensis TaxID=2305225 RepID=A0A3N6N1T8_9BURK|nr:hypothetical protein D1Y85_01700 [Paraburkholderia dinghuensis]